jgi:FkbM family methyltransferase
MISVKQLFKKFIPPILIDLYRRKANERPVDIEVARIRQLPRYKNGKVKLNNGFFYFPDSASFCFIYDEIFKKEIYKFNTTSPIPYIVDAGANIGLSVLYFKQLYPNSKIVAFEPDDYIFSYLKKNIIEHELDGVLLIKKALWDNETSLKFYSEGADGGRIANQNDKDKIINVQTIQLREFISKKVDLLKIDIEGAETKVLINCRDLLVNVERIFVEYHSFRNEPQELHHLLSILNSAGFKYQVQHIGVFSPNPFVKINSYINMDLQLNIFAYRL